MRDDRTFVLDCIRENIDAVQILIDDYGTKIWINAPGCVFCISNIRELHVDDGREHAKNELYADAKSEITKILKIRENEYNTRFAKKKMPVPTIVKRGDGVPSVRGPAKPVALKKVVLYPTTYKTEEELLPEEELPEESDEYEDWDDVEEDEDPEWDVGAGDPGEDDDPEMLPEEELPPEEDPLVPVDVCDKPGLTEDELNKLICEKLEQYIDEVVHSPAYRRWVMLATN